MSDGGYGDGGMEEGFFDGEGAESTEDTGEEGPCGKMMSACICLIIGIVLFPASLALLGWNEQQFVCTDKTILWSQDNAVAAGCDSTGVTGYTFFSCPLDDTTLQTFQPCLFNKDSGESCAPGTLGTALSFQGVSGSQLAEIYTCQKECETTTHKVGGVNKKRTVCTYRPIWSETEIDATGWDYSKAGRGCPGFYNSNPTFPPGIDAGISTDYMPGPLLTSVATNGTAPFTISESLFRQLSPDTPVEVTDAAVTGAAMMAPEPGTQPYPAGLTVQNMMKSPDMLHLQSCATDTIGCVRLSYSRGGLPGTSPSVLSAVDAGVTAPQAVPGSWLCPEGTYEAIYKQTLDLDGTIAQLRDDLQMKTWILRILGVILAWASVYMCLEPISAAADIMGDCFNMIPCIGGYLEDVIEGAVSAIICLVSCSVGCTCSFLVIGIVWLAMRPLYGGLMLGAAVIMCCCGASCLHMGKDQKRAPCKKGGAKAPFSNAPVDARTARGFIAALTEEYVNDQGGSVGDFFNDNGAAADELQQFEDQIRDADNKQNAIDRLCRKWGCKAAE